MSGKAAILDGNLTVVIQPEGAANWAASGAVATEKSPFAAAVGVGASADWTNARSLAGAAVDVYNAVALGAEISVVFATALRELAASFANIANSPSGTIGAGVSERTADGTSAIRTTALTGAVRTDKRPIGVDLRDFTAVVVAAV